MARKLRAVGPGESASVPRSLLEAAECGRRELLVQSRTTIARAIEQGVPAHALARLINEMNGIDAEIRRLDAVVAEDEEVADVGRVVDGVWEAI